MEVKLRIAPPSLPPHHRDPAARDCIDGAGNSKKQSSCDEEQGKEKEPLVVIPYVAGMCEDIRCVCRKFNIRVVFKSGPTLHSMLTKVKDTLPLGKQSNVVCCIPCSCGQV